MGRVGTWIAEVLGFERAGTSEETKVDPGGGANATADHTGPPGLDAPPLPGDYAALQKGSGSGTVQAVGYTDPRNERQAQPGEFRGYARDANGLVVGSLWLKGDGTIVASNANAQVIVHPDGVAELLCPEVRLGNAAGQGVARQGDLVSIVIPKLLSAAPGSPCVPVPPTAVTPSGNYVGSGQIISGATTVKAGP